jgi:hypothetical protein
VNGDSFTASGLRKNESESSLFELTKLIGNYHAEKINPAYRKMGDSYIKFKGLLGNRYAR